MAGVAVTALSSRWVSPSNSKSATISSDWEPGEIAAGSRLLGRSTPMRKMPPVTGASLLMLADELTAAGFFESVQATRTARSTTAATIRRSTRMSGLRGEQEPEADGGERKHERGDHRDAVEVAADDRRARG